MPEDANHTVPSGSRLVHLLAVFATKTVIVVAVTTVSLSFLLDHLVGSLQTAIHQEVKQFYPGLERPLGETGTFTRFEELLDRAVLLSGSIPAERQQNILDNMHILAQRARPYILEVENAFLTQDVTIQK